MYNPYRVGISAAPLFASPGASGGSVTDTSNDELLARMLQLEFDKEHDTMLRAEERAYNKDSKGL